MVVNLMSDLKEIIENNYLNAIEMIEILLALVSYIIETIFR